MKWKEENRFAKISQNIIGFDDLSLLFRNIEGYDFADREQTNYPPYNIEKISAEDLEIKIAVAGFKKKELKVLLHGTIVVIIGKKEHSSRDNYIYKGIASRCFEKVFLIATDISLEKAFLEHGILTIKLHRNCVQSQSIEIEIE